MEEIEQQIDTPVVEESSSLRDAIESAAKEVRTRDEAGRFAKTELVDTPEPVKQEKTEPAAETGKVQEIKPEQPAEEKPNRPTLAPNSFSAAAKAEWEKVPASVQAEIARREADIHREFTRQDGERQFAKAMKTVIDPYMPLISQQGGNPMAVVKNMLETSRVLFAGDPATKTQAIRQLIQQVGIDPQALFTEQPHVDPTLQTLQQKVAAFEEQQRQQQYMAQQQQQAQTQSMIDAFAADPKNVHFEHVKGHMAALLQAGQAKDLQDAYDQAVWARPDIRSTLLTEQQKAAEAQRAAEMKAKADAARRAAGSVVGSPGIGQSIDPKAGMRSLRDELAAQFAAKRV
jgi:hypothetical protein